MPKKRVLLVDDNAVVLSAGRRLFDSHPDFEVSGEADNGREAIEKAEHFKPDLIILDLAMPVMTGLDAAPVLRKCCPSGLYCSLTDSKLSSCHVRLRYTRWFQKGRQCPSLSHRLKPY